MVKNYVQQIVIKRKWGDTSLSFNGRCKAYAVKILKRRKPMCKAFFDEVQGWSRHLCSRDKCYVHTIDCIEWWTTCLNFFLLCKKTLLTSFWALVCTELIILWRHGIKISPLTRSIVSLSSQSHCQLLFYYCLTETIFVEKVIWCELWLFSFAHVPFNNIEEANFVTYTAASHLGVIKMIWLLFLGSCHIAHLYNLWDTRPTWYVHVLNIFKVPQIYILHNKSHLKPPLSWLSSDCFFLLLIFVLYPAPEADLICVHTSASIYKNAGRVENN